MDARPSATANIAWPWIPLCSNCQGLIEDVDIEGTHEKPHEASTTLGRVIRCRSCKTLVRLDRATVFVRADRCQH